MKQKLCEWCNVNRASCLGPYTQACARCCEVHHRRGTSYLCTRRLEEPVLVALKIEARK